jgi:hypothetical protein
MGGPTTGDLHTEGGLSDIRRSQGEFPIFHAQRAIGCRKVLNVFLIIFLGILTVDRFFLAFTIQEVVRVRSI